MTTTVHALCLDLARTTDSRLERYLLLRLALRAERADLSALMDSPAVTALVGGLAPGLNALLTRLVSPRVAPATPN